MTAHPGLCLPARLSRSQSQWPTWDRVAEGTLRVQELEASGKLADAAVAFLACQAHEAAVRCYTQAGEWQMAFALLLQGARDAAPVRKLAEDLIEQLCSTGRPAEAGTVAETYLRDGERALELYVEAGEWRRALAVVGQVHRGAAAEAALAPAAAAAASAQLADARADAARALKYSVRLQALRGKRAQMAEALGAPLPANCAKAAPARSVLCMLCLGRHAEGRLR